MTDAPVAFHVPFVSGRELEFVADAVARRQFSGDGHYTSRASSQLGTLVSVDRPLLTTSCTHALELAALLLDLELGDEVIMPSFTFVSTANAFVLRGATPVFVDIRPDTLESRRRRTIEAAITPRTRAIVPVHYAGVACEMDAIMEIAAASRPRGDEDAAHGARRDLPGRPLGTYRRMAALSFHETEEHPCGEGGRSS